MTTKEKQRAGADFYCTHILSGQTPVRIVSETPHVLAFHHTRPAYPVHIVVMHILSLIETDGHDQLLLELLSVVRDVAGDVLRRYGACRVMTNLGEYQDARHLHWHVVSGPAKT